MREIYDVVIIGGGVSGAANAWMLREFTNVGSILMTEARDKLATINSHPLNNAQTSHAGERETNYSLEHALEVQHKAFFLRNYVLKSNAPGLYELTSGMVIGVGEAEVALLETRHKAFLPHYPDLRLIYGDAIAKIEPMVMKGRDPNEPICALTNQSFTINYQRLAECLVKDAQAKGEGFDIAFNTRVRSIRRVPAGFSIKMESGQIVYARYIIGAAGAYSIPLAQQVGLVKNLGILSVKGDFYTTPSVLNGKVYCIQEEGIPFAEPHGDKDITNPDITRWGPTTKPEPLMEARHYGTAIDYARQPTATPKGIWALLNILVKSHLVGYVAENFLFSAPVIGTWFFLQKIRKVVPTLRYRDLKRRPHAGGIRPQIVDIDTQTLIMGDMLIKGKGCCFIPTPSPGASASLGNAELSVEHAIEYFGGDFTFDKDRLEAKYGHQPVLPMAA